MKAVTFMPIAGAVVLSVALATASNLSQAQGQSPTKTIELSEVPKPARDSAKKALRTEPTTARILLDTNPQQYELAAKDESGRNISVHVQGDGKVTGKKVEVVP